MTKRNLLRIVFFCVVLLLQIVFDYYINLGTYIYLCFIPLLIIHIPQQVSAIKSMLLAFLFGMLIDILCDGVLGLNAAAAVATAALRGPILALTIGNLNESYRTPSIKNSGFLRFFQYCFIITLVYLLVYIIFDGANLNIGFKALKLAASLAINVFLSIIITHFFNFEE